MEENQNTIHNFIGADTTFPAAIHTWEVHLADQGRSIYTIKAFRSDVQLMASFFSPDKTIGSVTTRDINAFLDWMNNERKIPCSPKTYARRVTSIKVFFKWLEAYGAIKEDPADRVVQKSAVSPLPEILTLQEYTRVLQTANEHRTGEKPDARMMTLLQLLLSTGIKKGETLELTRNHIERDNPEEPILHVRYANPESRYKERTIELPIDWLTSYDEYLEQYKPSEKIFPWSPRRLEYLLEDIGREAGLTKHLSFAMCRWSCATHDLYTNNTPEAIRQKLGVSKIQWREIYNKLTQLKPFYLNEETAEKSSEPEARQNNSFMNR